MAFQPCLLLDCLSNLSRNTQWIWFVVHFYLSSLVTNKYLNGVYQGKGASLSSVPNPQSKLLRLGQGIPNQPSKFGSCTRSFHRT